MENICGYAVVRTPLFNFDAKGRGAFSALIPQLDDRTYGGLDRMRWFDVYEGFFNNLLPPNITSLLMGIESRNRDLTGINVTQSQDEVFELLEYSNRIEKRNEIAVIQSNTLNDIKGVVSVDEDLIVWRGFDAISIGSGSLLREGIFRHPQAFDSFLGLLNHDGLLPDTDTVNRYIKHYKEQVDAGVAEFFSDTLYGTEAVRVGIGLFDRKHLQ